VAERHADAIIETLRLRRARAVPGAGSGGAARAR
jgi:hypothetical protein